MSLDSRGKTNNSELNGCKHSALLPQNEDRTVNVSHNPCVDVPYSY